jgi:hypothetical protein
MMQMQDDAASEKTVGAKAAAIQALAEIRKNFPKSEDAHAAVWAVMTDAQKPVAEAKMKELLAKESEQKMLPGVQNQVQTRIKNEKFKEQQKKREVKKELNKEERKDSK